LTICIAAAAGKDHVVVASDRMVTLSIPSTEFEQNLSKTVEITKNSVAAAAGNALAYTTIHNETLKLLQQDSTNPGIQRIAELIRRSYVKARNDKLEQDILVQFGLNMQTFYDRNQKLSPNIVANIVQAMSQYNFNLSILVAGVDSKGPHIFRVDTPGRIETFDSIGHCSVGTGELHAISTFIANDYGPDLDLDHVVAMVYEAKKKSEKAQGVGEETDICIICNDGIVKLPDDKMEKLNEFYDKKIEQEKKSVSETEDLVKTLGIQSIDENKTNS